jgi:hypothetical protein
MKPLTEPIGSAADALPPKTSVRSAISLQVKGENVLFADAHEFVFPAPAAAQEFGRAVMSAALKLYRKSDAGEREGRGDERAASVHGH